MAPLPAPTMQTLEDYKISPVTGCLLRQPTPTPPTLQPFEKLLKHSHQLLASKKLREAVEKLPTLDLTQITSHTERRLAHKILAFLASQYVWQNGGDDPAEILPCVLAMPLMEVSIELGCQPLIGHIDLVLSNCFPEKTQPLHRQSFFTEFFPSAQENWVPFIEITADIELTFCDGAKTIMHIIHSIDREDPHELSDCLYKLGEIVSVMQEQMLLLLKELDAKAFYCEMRPFLSGWSHGKMSKGLVYEGVPDSVLTGAEVGDLSGNTIPKKRVYLGASAGQSICLQAIDALMGVEHYPDAEDFLVSLRNYMIREHRKFIEDIKRHVHLREFIEKLASAKLKKAYNACLNSVIHFRKAHTLIVEKFVIEPSKKYAANVESLKSQGTGGSDLNKFLEQVISKTEEYLYDI